MKSHIQWLKEELKRWVAEEVIDDSQAEAISQLYPESKPRPWALIVFSGIGAIITGLGVILLFAYNWDEIPKFAKLGIIFGTLAAAHVSGIHLYLRNDRFKGLGEALTVLGTMLFGSGIWLVAQIYHIQEHFANGFLLWALGALVMAWALPSIAQGIIAAVLFTIWSGAESMHFGNAMHAAPVVVLVLLGSLAYIKRSRVLLAIVILAFAFSMGFGVGTYTHGEFLFNVLISMAAALVALGMLSRRYGKFPEAQGVLHFLGFAGYVVMLYILTFPDAAEEILEFDFRQGMGGLFYWIPVLAAALVTWGMVAWKRLCPRDMLLIPLTIILCQTSSFFGGGWDDWALAAPFNLVFLAHAGSMMARGCRRSELQPTVLGSLMLAALAFARYADLFQSLLARGLVFVLVGGLLFVEGIYYARSKRDQVENVT